MLRVLEVLERLEIDGLQTWSIESVASRNAIDMDPAFVLPHLVLGQAYEQKKAYDQAIVELRRATELSLSSPPALAALARTFAVSGRITVSKKSVRAIAAIEETICFAFLRGDRVRGPGRK